GLIGPWAHAYPHFAKPGPAIGFLQEALRWWDHWLKGIDTGVMDEPMLRAWMMESVRPARHHHARPGRWVAETAWPPPGVVAQHWALRDGGLLGPRNGEERDLTPVALCSPADLGAEGGSWCPFGRGPDQAGDQRADDAQSLCFETGPLAASVDILGAPVITLELAADRPLANLAVRLCDVHPDGASLRVSFGILNLAHRESHEAPSPLEPGRRYTVRLALNDAGFVFPAGHRIRLALSTAYWPMMWPAPEAATLTLFGGVLELPVRTAQPHDDALAPLPPPETAPPAPRREVVRDGRRLTRIDAIGIEFGADVRFVCRLDDPADPLSARIETERSAIVVRGDWCVRILTRTTMRAERDAFLLTATMRAYEAEEEVSARDWDSVIPRDLV
ncbi:MAG: CocE/NonD family hydrolase, partial [Acetobacteraceae bacterium]|nr:CocE/NonD family hydrolase [Acetobacteraceae bacterium]